MNSKRLAGKCAVITGSAGGIAIATALSFGREGANVVVVDIDQPGVEETAALVAAEGAGVKARVATSPPVQTCGGHFPKLPIFV